MAANKYDFFGEQAAKEGYEQIKGYFWETADNERQHAKRIFRFLGGVGTTEDNLKAGAEGEHEEWADIYKEMEQVAKEEGFEEIALFFRNLASVEKEHEVRYQALLRLMQEKRVFQDTEQTVWVCRNCGFVYVGAENRPKHARFASIHRRFLNARQKIIERETSRYIEKRNGIGISE